MTALAAGPGVIMPMLKERLEPHRGVWEVFKRNGFKAYFVGGCVRDALYNRTAKDIDIATNATPAQTKELFENYYDSGLKFGSLTVSYEDKYYDITTLRTEGGYTNFRHPEIINYTNDIEMDLKRRDFTVNAMAYSFDEGHIDLFGGVTDLNKKSLRVVGKANLRFKEDALRMLRAVRFSCELGFTIEKGTLAAIRRNARGIKYISKERIYSEFKRAVTGDFPGNLTYLRQTSLGAKIDPIFKVFNYHNIPKDKDYILRLTHILKKKETAMTALNYLKADKFTLQSVIHVMDGVRNLKANSGYSIRRLIADTGPANAKRVLIIKNYDMGTYDHIIENKECTSLADLAINGNDLITTGITTEGVGVRHILNILLNEVLKDPDKNKFEVLLPMARNVKTVL